MSDETRPHHLASDGDEPVQGMRCGLTNYGDAGFSLFLRKAFIKGSGLSDDALARPLVGIVNTASGYNPCHGNMSPLIDAVKRGVMLAGGLPMDFPTISVHESFSQPTSMYLRNLMSMDTEEMIRAQPMDVVVLIGGCDKTVPAQLMGAACASVPAIQLVTGSMLTGSYRGERVGTCTDCRRYWGQYRADEIDDHAIAEVNNQLVASVGTCSVMGTASTMTCLTEAMARRIDDPDLDVRADDVLVLKRISPVGAPGMPEAGYMPIPRKLARAGAKDMVRISDGRMSGTAAGTIVLHVTPEAAVGGTLAHVQNGDRIRLSVARREITLLLDDAELARRVAQRPEPRPEALRGYRKLFLDTVTQADQGVDFDFLRAVAIRETVPSKS